MKEANPLIRQSWKLLLRSAAGFAALFLFNAAGGGFGLSVGLNILNAGVVGVLGLPGFALLLVLQYLTL
jgi:inhibitor of the pro-sigma K processing machinery